MGSRTLDMLSLSQSRLRLALSLAVAHSQPLSESSRRRRRRSSPLPQPTWVRAAINRDAVPGIQQGPAEWVDALSVQIRMLHQSVRFCQPPPCTIALGPRVTQVQSCSQVQRLRPLLFRIYLPYATAYQPARKSPRLTCLDHSFWASKSNWHCSPRSRVSSVPARQHDDAPWLLRQSSLPDEISLYCQGCNGGQRADQNRRVLGRVSRVQEIPQSRRHLARLSVRPPRRHLRSNVV